MRKAAGAQPPRPDAPVHGRGVVYVTFAAAVLRCPGRAAAAGGGRCSFLANIAQAWISFDYMAQIRPCSGIIVGVLLLIGAAGRRLSGPGAVELQARSRAEGRPVAGPGRRRGTPGAGDAGSSRCWWAWRWWRPPSSRGRRSTRCNEGLRVDKDQVLLVFVQPRQRVDVRRYAGAGCPRLRQGGGSWRLGLTGSGNIRRATSVASTSFTGKQGRHGAAAGGGGGFGLLRLSIGIRLLAGRTVREGSRPPRDGTRTTRRPWPCAECQAPCAGWASPRRRTRSGKTVKWHGIWDESMRRETSFVPPAKPSQIVA